ncbi:MAG TPA: flagellar biosynthesis protein FlhF [Macromonas sp.]|nr:flagellar biosynthesis protein FlhF [Macromonas sp.]
MNVQRFIAPNSREAMALARAAYGDSAVILSSRSSADGFEVVATAEENLDSLASQTAQTAAPVTPRSAAQRGNLQQRAAQQLPPPANSSVAQDTETMAMSTLSFQDYVRERMLRKRREALQGTPTEQAPAARPATKAERGEDMTLPFARAAEPARAAAKAKPAAAAPAKPSAAEPTPKEAVLTEQFNALKAMMEERFNTLAWMGTARQNTIQSSLMHKLIRAGYSPTVARSVMERLPADYSAKDAFRWTQEVLARNLKTAQDSSALCDEGGVFALVGSTGVGKTTTAAKLAAQCVKAYGPNSVGLITLDTYRVAGYEQLRAYGRMLGVVAHLAHDRAALQDLLTLLSNKRMVIIDTAGLGQKDPRIQEMMDVLASPKIKKLLVLNAGSHGDTLDDVLQAYKGVDLYGVVLSKVDEAAKLGPAVDVLIRHQVVLRGLSTGQRVPEDWQRPDAQALVRMSMASSGKSAYDPQSSELAFFFTDPVQQGVQLDAWHV